jgi:hypothetical protein
VGSDRQTEFVPASTLWIGGGSGAGKSTVARRLASTYGLTRYSTDDAMADHTRRCSAAECPELARFMAMDMDERWLKRSPWVMVETFHWYRGEGFRFVLDDVEELLSAGAERVVVEGFRLLPRLVAPLLGRGARALWLLPTPEFRLQAFHHRGGLWQIAGRTSCPERALANLLERDRMFTERVRTEVRELGLVGVDVDVGLGEDELVVEVAKELGLSIR